MKKESINILSLPNYLSEIRIHLEDSEMDIDNRQMGVIFSWMLSGVSAKEAAKNLEDGMGGDPN